MDEMKRCTTCGQDKPATLEFFGPNCRTKSGLKASCRECRRLEIRAYKKNKAAISAAAQARREDFERLAAQGLKRCVECKEVKQATREFFYGAPKEERDGLTVYCKECLIARGRRRYATNRDAVLGINQRSYQKTRVRIRAHRRSRYEELKSDPRAWKEYLAQNRERARRWRRENPEKARERWRKWRLSNPIAYRASSARRRAAIKSAESNFTAGDVRAIIAKQNNCCFYCGSQLKGSRSSWHVDHYIPISKGGGNGPSNIVIACQTCNLLIPALV